MGSTWTPENSFLLEYRARCKSGEIIIGHELMMELDRLADDVESGRYRYDTDDARLRIDFLEHCIRLTKSPYYNKPMKLMLWQKAWIEALYSFKMPDGSDRFKRAVLLIARKNTKALALDTPIVTPDGMRTIADIQPGDFVYSPDGKPTNVMGVSEIFKNRPCYEVEFSDGDSVIADAGHKWTVTRRYSHGKRCETLTTSAIARDYVRGAYDRREYKYQIAMTKPLEFPENPELFPPYVLGYWIGNGDRGDNRVSCDAHDAGEIAQHFRDCGVHVQSIKQYGDSRKTEIRFGVCDCATRTNSAREALRALGVWENKHIPESYVRASIEQRRELIRGLMDSDGTVTKRGQCVFTQKDKGIADGVSRVLSTLGIKHTVRATRAKIGDVDYGTAYSISFYVTKRQSCFRLARKTARLKDKLTARPTHKQIVRVTPVTPRDTKCITVENPDGLFLCGGKHTVTHNSETTAALVNAEFIVGPSGADICCSSNDDAQSSIVYDAVDLMRQLYDPGDVDTKRNIRFILNKASNTKIFKLSDRTKNKEGRNIDFAIVDEAHEMKENVIVKSIEQSQSLKENPKLVIITTEGFVYDGFLDQELKRCRAIIKGEDDSAYAERVLPWLYTQDSEQEVWRGDRNNRLWMKSNPTLGTIKRWEYMEEQVDAARTSKADRVFVLSKDFNIKQAVSEAWLDPKDLAYSATYDISDFRGCVALGAVDLAETTDLCAAKVLIMRPDDRTKYVISHYFIPQGKLENADDWGAGARYKDWAKQGCLTITDGFDVDLGAVADWFYMLYRDHGIRLWKCGYDQRFARDWIARMESYGWAGGRGDSDLEMVLQNAQTLSAAMKLAESDLKHRIINFNDNPVDRWCLANAGIKITDSAGRCLCVKRENQKRIDGAVCLIILWEMERRHRSDYMDLVNKNNFERGGEGHGDI